MTNTYKTQGINLKGAPMGENDRILTILSPEYGLIRAIVPGARKHKSRLRGKSELFVVNDLLIVKGRSLDKIIQAETIESYPALSRSLDKLTASQYLGELILHLASSELPQAELYTILNEHLRRLAGVSRGVNIYPYLCQGILHCLAIAGIAPQVQICCHSQTKIIPNFQQRGWQVGFSFEAGGAINLASEAITTTDEATEEIPIPKFTLNYRLDPLEFSLLQNLGYRSIVETIDNIPQGNFDFDRAWLKIERLLRDYIKYQLGSPIRAASLVDVLSSDEFPTSIVSSLES
jgi:DNA repair protein RecO (recombination protein O)